MRYALIDRQQDVVARDLGSPQQFTILLALQTRPLSGAGVMDWEAVTEIEWRALIQQNLYAIRASKESFASSSAWTAISRGTVGNWRRNSPREWPPSI